MFRLPTSPRAVGTAGRPHRFSAAKKALTSTRNYNDDSPATSVRSQRSPNAGNGIAPAARV